MYIIVGGGGQVGLHLTKGLISQGHEVLLLDKDPLRVTQLQREVGKGSAERGDACEVAVLESKGCGRADVVIAVTGDDEDNLVICQVAKARFKVKHTVARVNNPQHDELFRKLGIDDVISPTSTILHLIEAQIPHHSVIPLVPLTRAGLHLVEVTVPIPSGANGLSVDALNQPGKINVILVQRGGKPLTLTKETTLQRDDQLFVVVNEEGEKALHDIVLGDYS